MCEYSLLIALGLVCFMGISFMVFIYKMRWRL
jgi:hypothetical protein